MTPTTSPRWRPSWAGIRRLREALLPVPEGAVADEPSLWRTWRGTAPT